MLCGILEEFTIRRRTFQSIFGKNTHVSQSRGGNILSNSCRSTGERSLVSLAENQNHGNSQIYVVLHVGL